MRDNHCGRKLCCSEYSSPNDETAMLREAHLAPSSETALFISSEIQSCSSRQVPQRQMRLLNWFLQSRYSIFMTSLHAVAFAIGNTF